MAESAAQRSGPERFAILLMSLGEEYAGEVLRQLSPREVQQLGTAMASLGAVPRSQRDEVVSDFTARVSEQTSLGVGTEDYLRRLLVGALGEQKAGGLIDQILAGGTSTGIESLKWMDPRSVAEVVRLEHPQIIATIISRLEADHAAAVLRALPSNMVPDVLMRVATLESIQPGALRELDEILEKQFAGRDGLKSSVAGGVKAAAGIMTQIGGAMEGSVLEEIRRAEPDLAEAISENMFVFDDLRDLEPRDIQRLLRDVDTEALLVALKGADTTVVDHFLSNMSRRAAEGLRDDMESRGPVRVSEVEDAQKSIVTLARGLADQGDINLSGGGESFV